MEQDSDNEDHLYQLIQGVPAVMVSNGNSQSKWFYPEKRNHWSNFLKKTDGKKKIFGGKDLFFYKRSKNV